MLEAQGVEFDLVFLVGIKKDSFANSNISTEYFEERKRMRRDLLYVALTRAITELHILGLEKLSSLQQL
jgi:superfamily I DNA/RNA helicase